MQEMFQTSDDSILAGRLVQPSTHPPPLPRVCFIKEYNAAIQATLLIFLEKLKAV